jgi:hypothetical protein
MNFPVTGKFICIFFEKSNCAKITSVSEQNFCTNKLFQLNLFLSKAEIMATLDQNDWIHYYA